MEKHELRDQLRELARSQKTTLADIIELLSSEPTSSHEIELRERVVKELEKVIDIQEVRLTLATFLASSALDKMTE